MNSSCRPSPWVYLGFLTFTQLVIVDRYNAHPMGQLDSGKG